MTRLPLEGMLIVDLTIWLYGPLAGELLADLGARVIKIERPGGGDFTRALPRLQAADLFLDDGRNLAFELFNRNKASLALDMRDAAGQEIFHRLVARADAFVTNFQPSTLARFRALPSELLERNPRLVYGLGAGLGTKGSLADVPSQDTAAMAYSGFMFTASPNADEPFYPPGGLGDVLAGTNLAFGVVSALVGRERDGHGRLVTTSLLQSLLWTQMVNVGVPANNGQRLRGAPWWDASSPFMNTYRCADGTWLALGNPYLNDAAWKQVTDVLEAPELAADPRFATEAERWRRRTEIIAELDVRIVRRARDAWLARCRAHDLWCAPVHRPEELERDPATIEQEIFARTGGGVRHVRGPFTLEGAPPRTGDAPALGSSTREVLAELGFDAAEIARLLTRGVVAG